MKNPDGKSFSISPAGGDTAEQDGCQAVTEPLAPRANGSSVLCKPANQARNLSAIPSGEKPCRVETLLVEPNGLFREGLKRILAGTAYGLTISGADFDEIGPMPEAGGSEFLLIVDAAQDHPATCERVRFLKMQYSSMRVVMLVERYDLEQMLAAIESGVSAYLLKSMSHEALLKTLDLVMLGETVFPVAVLAQLQDPASAPDPGDVNGLTRRERAILECLTDGASNKVIARRLDIAESTVKVHIKAILRKLKAKNRTQAAMWASNHIVKRKA